MAFMKKDSDWIRIAKCKRESECKFSMSPREGAEVAFFGTYSGVKKEASLTLEQKVLSQSSV